MPDPAGDHGAGAGPAGGMVLVAAEWAVQRDHHRLQCPGRVCWIPHRRGLRPPRQGVWGGEPGPAGLCPGPGARPGGCGGGHSPRTRPDVHDPSRGQGPGGHRPHLLRHRQPRVGCRGGPGAGAAAGAVRGDGPVQRVCHAGTERGPDRPAGGGGQQRLRRPKDGAGAGGPGPAGAGGGL